MERLAGRVETTVAVGAAAETSAGPQESVRRWYLVRTLTGREMTAAFQLERQGFEVFLPKQMKTVRHARRVRSVLAAFFPGYLFVSLDLGRDRWRSINGTLGVAHLVGQGDRPTAAPHRVVQGLRDMVDERGVFTTPMFKPGQDVRVAAGPFVDHLAVIERLDGAGRVRVLLALVNGRVPVDLPQEFLEPYG